MSTGVSRIQNDIAGGLIIGNLAPSVIIEGTSVTVLGAAVTSHGSGQHASATMLEASSSVYANGIRICRENDAASCGHQTSGSSTVFVG